MGPVAHDRHRGLARREDLIGADATGQRDNVHPRRAYGVAPATSDPRAFVLNVVDGAEIIRLYVGNGELTERGEVPYQSGEAVMYPVTITAYPDDNGNLMTKFSNSAAWGEDIDSGSS